MPPVNPEQPKRTTLGTVQLRILKVLADSGGILTRLKIQKRVGFSTLSATVTNTMNGVAVGSTHCKRGKVGLLALGLVEKIQVEVVGVLEEGYRITPLGKQALEECGGGNDLPPLKDRTLCTNSNKKKG